MVFVAQHDLTGTFELLGYLSFVVIVETMSLVAKPDSNGDRQSKGVRLIKQCIDVVGTPGADRISARGRKLFRGVRPARAANKVRFATAQQ